ncbi:MAG: hypothetical protein ACI4WX_04460 [Aristaeellaceae bacterium]
MKTDMITVSSTGRQIEAALNQAEKVAAYKGLSPKSALHLRLLTEEMMGMMRAITGEKEGQFWIEDEDNTYQLHLLVNSRISLDKRDQLLAASTSGKNEAARGLMGRLLDFFDQGADGPSMPLFHENMMGDMTSSTLNYEWSMTTYQNELRRRTDTDERAREMWDELEKSVVTHVADDIKVFIRGQRAEMIVIKKLQ